MSGKLKSSLSAAVPLAVLAVLWLIPAPEGLTAQAWHMFAIFIAVIIAILTQPLPSGAIMLIGLCVAIVTTTLSQAKALAGFASGTVWLIFSAYVLSLGFVETGLGRRIAYKMLSMFGGSSLGIAYALGIADLFIAPATPSVTARSGGVILPIAKSINDALDSKPGPTGKKIGDFLILSCFQITPVTGAIFMTGMAANPLATSLAEKTLGIEITWAGWAAAAIVPMLLCFAVTPYVIYKLVNPEMKHTPEGKEMGKKSLTSLGSMSRKEVALTIIFLLALLGWATSLITKLSATTVGLCVVALLFIFRVVDWKSVLRDYAAWDTVIWFGAIISLATGLSDLGFISWMTNYFGHIFSGWSWIWTFIALGLIYIYIHYFFATASGHVAAMYPMFLATAITAGAPSVMVAICFGIFGNLMWGLTEYGGGPGPIYFAQGYYERPRFYKLNFAVVSINVLITFTVGLAWWKVIGLW
ncbi:DASS family sodium-coupled anion symporter [Geovibrio ferrireducens]|uniref:DASS family sodium-coupled anion symporter n=1 Tax=Geovibrio ferrireducens TaxID=46201 RepID=UPI00224708B1|nr:DASS family sodium-coupled anion symporter [Geovibrio ferrireducens]